MTSFRCHSRSGLSNSRARTPVWSWPRRSGVCFLSMISPPSGDFVKCGVITGARYNRVSTPNLSSNRSSSLLGLPMRHPFGVDVGVVTLVALVIGGKVVFTTRAVRDEYPTLRWGDPSHRWDWRRQVAHRFTSLVPNARLSTRCNSTEGITGCQEYASGRTQGHQEPQHQAEEAGGDEHENPLPPPESGDHSSASLSYA